VRGAHAFLPSPPAPLPQRGRGEPRANAFGVLKRQLQHQAEAALPHSIITAWARGVGAHGGAPCCAFPLARHAGEGDKGGEGNTARPPVHAHAGKIAPASAILCRTDVPLSAAGGGDKGGEGKTHPIPCKTCLYLPTIEPARNSLASAGMSLASTGMSPASTGMSLASAGMSLASIGMSLASIGMSVA
jgi:hypothetical protein